MLLMDASYGLFNAVMYAHAMQWVDGHDRDTALRDVRKNIAAVLEACRNHPELDWTRESTNSTLSEKLPG